MRAPQPTIAAGIPWLLALAALCAAAVAVADSHVPSGPEFEEALPEGGSLSGREIHERFLRNRFRRSVQSMRVVSTDPGGSEQSTSFSLSYEDFRDGNNRPTDGIKAKTLVEVFAPFDMRHTQYLMISKDPGPDDQFVYQPSQRKVKRVDLRRTPLMGTDYTFDDVAFHDIDEAEYVRLPDEQIEGTPVYVVEAFINDTLDVEYHRTVSYLEQEHYVPLRVRYWDAYGVEMKELTAPHAHLREFDGTWIATKSTMHDLLQRTSSTLYVIDMDTQPTFGTQRFTVSAMASA
ncbi:MAG: outer membrane lipoprotein-sorting protein [Myxococcota bacterium]